MWKAVKALIGTFAGGTLGSYLLITSIKNPDEAGATTLGISTGIIASIIYDVAKGV